jgi:hypothetical protein
VNIKTPSYVFQSGGEMENDERIANVIYGLITLTDRLDSTVHEDGYKRISGTWQMVTQILWLQFFCCIVGTHENGFFDAG